MLCLGNKARRQYLCKSVNLAGLSGDVLGLVPEAVIVERFDGEEAVCL